MAPRETVFQLIENLKGNRASAGLSTPFGGTVAPLPITTLGCTACSEDISPTSLPLHIIERIPILVNPLITIAQVFAQVAPFQLAIHDIISVGMLAEAW